MSSISFKSVKGFNNKVNLGDSSYNFKTSSSNFNKNNIVTNGNPSNWNGNHNIEKEIGQSIQTRYKEKVGSEILNETNRNTDYFNDRMSSHISLYPKNTNLMAKGVDYGGSTPYKLGNNRSAAAACDFKISDYVSDTTINEHALSRQPVKFAEAFTNIQDTNHPLSNTYLQPTNIKSLKQEYLVSNVHTNLISKENFKTMQPDKNEYIHKINQNNISTNINSNKYLTNNFNNNKQNNDVIPVNENYQSISANTNLKSDRYISNLRNNVDVSSNIKHGTPLMADIHTNKHYTTKNINNQNRDVELYKDKMNTNAMTNKIGDYNKLKDNRHVQLSKEVLNTNIHTNIKKNSNEIDLQRQKIELYKNNPRTNIHTNIVKPSNHMEQNRSRQVELPDRLNINNHYNNQGVGPRAQTKNLEYNL